VIPKRVIENILSSIKNMLSWARVTNILSDDQQLPSGQVEYMEKVRDIVYVFPYGYNAQPLLDNLAIKANVGSDENAVAFPISWNTREQGLKQGEIAIKNGITDTLIKWAEDGSMAITVKKTKDVDGNDQGGDLNLTTENDVNITSSNDFNLSTTNDVDIDGGNNIEITSTNDIDIDSGNEILIDAVGDITINAPNTT